MPEDKVSGDSRNYFELHINENIAYQTCGTPLKQLIHCTKMLTLEKRKKIAVKYLNVHLRKLEEEQIKPKESWKRK